MYTSSMADTDPDLLNEVIRIFTELRALTDPFVDHTSTVSAGAIPTSSLVKSTLHFKFPAHSDMFNLLFFRGASRELAEELANIHYERAYDLASKYSAIYDQNWNELSQSGFGSQVRLSKLALLLETKFHKIEQKWKQEVVASMHPRRRKRTQRRPCSFNHDFIPCLETFFKENTRPSRADKLFLSRKSGMSFKQVNIWFQNRRRRSKKPSSPIATSDRGVPVPVAKSSGKGYSEESRVENIEGDEDSKFFKCKSKASSRASSVTPVNEPLDTFTYTPPPSAFPTPYPPEPADYPFPCQRGDFSMPSPQWRRIPNNRPNEWHTQGDVLNVIESLARLTLEDETSIENELGGPCDVMAPYTVRPFPAPLPFLFATAQTSRPCILSLSPESTPDHEDDTFSSSSPSSPESSGPSTPSIHLPILPPAALLTESGTPADWCTSDLFLEDPQNYSLSLDVDVALLDSLALDRAGWPDLYPGKGGADESSHLFWDPELLSQFSNY